MIKKLLLLFLFTTIFVFPQAGNYYDALNTSVSSFITDLEARIRTPYTKVSYDQFDETNVTFFSSRDTTGGQRVVTCVYSGENYVYTPPFAWIPYSREHTWCQSWMPSGGTTTSPEGADQHHIFPVNQNQVNGVRSNHPLGNVVNVTGTYLAAKIGTNSTGTIVYEPRPIHKGDAARALFYMALKYNGIGGYNWSFNTLQTFLTTHSEGQIDLATIIAWHKQDPPDKWEMDRNNYVQSIQQNRNPLVDHPEYVNYINFNDITKLNPVYSVEPTNYATSFNSAYSSNQINLTWTSALAGTQAPSGYLLIAYDNNNYFIPIDGETYTNDSNLSDGAAVVNLNYSNTGYSFSNLSPNKRYYFTVFSYNGSGTDINYKINGTFPQTNCLYNGASITEPTIQASGLNFTSVKSNSITLNWTPGNGSSRIILAHAGNPVDMNPADLSTYTSSSVYGGGTQIGTGNYVVYKGSGNSFTLTGLNSSTNYYFKVYEFNGALGEENYLTTSPASGSQTTPSVTQPTVQTSSLTFSDVQSNELTLMWTNGNGSSRIVLASTSNVNSNPLDGQTYTDDSDFGNGSQLGSGNYVVYKGSGNGVTVTGLNPSTTYYFAVYEYNGSVGEENYLLTTPATGNQVTAAVTSHLIISEIYAGGGNSNAPYTHDYIVLYNPTGAPVNLGGWSVQYASAPASGIFSNTSNCTFLSGTIASGNYFIIRESSNANVGVAIPYYDLSGEIGLGASAGKLVLAHGTNAITGLSDPAVVDFVGYGSTANWYEGTGRAAAPSNTTSIRRKNNGTQDTDDNANDFVTVALSSNPPLPVELQSFTTIVSGRTVELNWMTITEKNNASFELQRSLNNAPDGSWTTVTKIQGLHSSNSPKNYKYLDSNLPSGKLWYRLKITDMDGNSEYSEIISADLSHPMNYELNQNYPNPFNPETVIEYSIPAFAKVRIVVYDALGKVVEQLEHAQKEAGYYKIVFNGKILSSGVYFYELTASGTDGTNKFRSVKKLMLVR